MRKPIIAGNWKMNKTIKEGYLEFIRWVKGKTEGDVEVFNLCTFTLLKFKGSYKGTNIKICAQICTLKIQVRLQVSSS